MLLPGPPADGNHSPQSGSDVDTVPPISVSDHYDSHVLDSYSALPDHPAVQQEPGNISSDKDGPVSEFRPSQVSSSEVLEAEAVSGLHIEAEFLTSIPKKTFSPAFFPSSRARR